MNGPQDLGGRMGFGPVMPEPERPVFHADWEKRVLGLTLCCGGLGYWTLDESRHWRESLPPADYLSFSYYQIWFTALVNSLVHYGEVTREELAGGEVRQPGVRTDRKVLPDDVPLILARGGPSERKLDSAPKFAEGDRVTMRHYYTHKHTRLPSYAMGKTGTVELVRRPHVFPDTAAHQQGDQPQWLYTIAFDGHELWGEGADPNLVVSIDAWESYIAS